MRLVTSFGPDGYEAYGKRFLETWEEHWSEHPLTVYIEQMIPETANLTMRSLWDIPWVDVRAWVDRHQSSLPLYVYSRKVFAQCDMAYPFNLTAEPYFWIDADTEIFGPAPGMDALLEAHTLAALRRLQWGWYTETGIVGFNPKHGAFGRFIDMYRGLYLSDEISRITPTTPDPSMRVPHDCAAFDAALMRSQATCMDLCSTDNEEPREVVGSSAFGQSIRHHKGLSGKGRHILSSHPEAA